MCVLICWRRFIWELRLKKTVVQRVTVVKFRVDNRDSDGTGLSGCFRIKVRTDTMYNGVHGYENNQDLDRSLLTVVLMLQCNVASVSLSLSSSAEHTKTPINRPTA